MYLANEALVTVFTDVTERSPTFSLAPLSTVDEYRDNERKSWIEILTPADSKQEAWDKLLGRKF